MLWFWIPLGASFLVLSIGLVHINHSPVRIVNPLYLQGDSIARDRG